MRTEGQSVSEAVLLLDLVKSSKLTAKSGNKQAHEIKEALRHVVEPAAAEHGATFVKFTGDGYFVTFSGENDAVRAAIAILQHVPKLVAERLRVAAVHCRIGIAFGELTVTHGKDRTGGAANNAARMEAANPATFHADPNGVTAEEFEQLHPRDRIFIDEHIVTGLSSELRALSRFLGWVELKDTGSRIKAYNVDWRKAGFIELPPYIERAPSLVPRPSENFVGRDDLTAAVAALLKEHRLVSLTGPGGIGKTQVAYAVAHGAIEAGSYGDGAFFVNLEGATSADAVLNASGLSHK